MIQPILQWLQIWYQNECNGDWEHGFGIHITTIDNPGWHIQIGLTDTELDGLEIAYNLEERAENDWYGISIKNNKYDAAGDPNKLTFLLESFQALVESKRKRQLAEYLDKTFPGRWHTRG
ncbi:MAG TPA: immunity 53 family protein [Pseudomonadota bacterium]|nr:immunity 53 family protein [Pseudomonadota bacterium]